MMAPRNQKQGERAKAAHAENSQMKPDAEGLTHASLWPTVQAALTLGEYSKSFGDLALPTLVADLREQCDLAINGNLGRAEALLITQAHTLNAIFNDLARKATNSEYLNQLESNLRLALKAQGQCRATLETLAAIKNPQPVAFVRQANIAHGPQQVNNGAVEDKRMPEIETQQGRLVEVRNDKPLDSGATGTASGTNSPLETVGGSPQARRLQKVGHVSRLTLTRAAHDLCCGNWRDCSATKIANSSATPSNRTRQ
jgi:hypothetical protein